MPSAFKGNNINKIFSGSNQIIKKGVMICLSDDNNNSDNNKSDDNFIAPDSEGSKYSVTLTPASSSNDNL